MSESWTGWFRERWAALAAGVGLWALLALGAVLFGGRTGQALWQQVVTLDEWVVAIGILPRVFIPVFRRDELNHPTARRVAGYAGTLTWVLLVVFLLDLLARAAFGLGMQPF